MSVAGLLVRNVEVEGRPGQDVRLADGRIAELGPRLAGGGEEIDGRGGALISGLIDHHIHLLAAAARTDSLVLDDVEGPAALAARLRAWALARPAGQWVRAVGYHESHAGPLGLRELDQIAPHNPVRVQHQTGALWILNSRALERLGGDLPVFVERDPSGALTGRVWRGDAWLQGRIGRQSPPLAPIGRALAAAGVTGVTDASVTTDADSAASLTEAVRAEALPLRLRLMSGGTLETPEDGAFTEGPLKVLLDDRDLPALDDLLERIAAARSAARPLAVHCVTASELALTLAALEAAGAGAGDRIEHGGVIPADAIGAIARLGLTVVTQPGLVFERGDRFLADVEPGEQPDLYRCASLLRAGVAVAGSSDAPYASLDPWIAMRTAVRRRTRGGRPIGLDERVSPAAALKLYQGGFDRPGGPARRVEPGAPADLCLLKAPLREALEALSADLVAATLVGGQLTFEAS